MERFVQIQWTAPEIEEARRIIRVLLEAKLIACGTIFPETESWFVWEGELEKVCEVKVFLKTTESNAKKIERLIIEHHSYECPEILTFLIEEGHSRYLEWIISSTKQSS